MKSGRPVVSLVVVAISLLVARSAAAAQEDAGSRGGFWLGAGAGGGFAESGDGGGAAFLRAGTTLSSRFRLGGEGLVFIRERDDVTLTPRNLTASLFYYPVARSGFFLQTGLGYAIMQSVVRREEETGVMVSEGALGTTFGLGWDLRLGDRDLHLTPAAHALLQHDMDHTAAFFLFTMGIGIR